jgi:hypothetical protein
LEIGMPNRFMGIVALLLSTCGLVGCGHPTVAVFSSANAKAPDLPGVPFYIKHGVCTEETVWLEPQYTLSLAVTADKQPPVTRTLTVNRAGYLAEDTQSLITALTGLGGDAALDQVNVERCPGAIGGEWDAVAAAEKKNWPVAGMDGSAASLMDAEAAGNLARVSNTAAVTTEVDYSKMYYINSKTPWIGTGSVNAKLATDGTLSEGGAQVQDQTWSTILGTVSSLAGSFTGLGAAEAAGSAGAGFVAEDLKPGGTTFACPRRSGWPVPVKTVKYAYSLATVVYKHDHVEKTGEVGSCAARAGGVTGGSFTVTNVSEAKEKADKDAIKVSGSITLPKADAGTPK